MPKQTNNGLHARPVSLLVLEGDTEEIFYPIVQSRFFHGIRLEMRNLKGRGNVNKDVLTEIFKYTYNNCEDFVRAYCCVDTEEQKRSATPFELDFVREHARTRQMTNVLSIDAILADPDIESWFFYDVDGIYRFLGAKKSQRSAQRYRNPKNLCKRDLQELFRRFRKTYLPGYKATHFINNLDIEKIVAQCGALRQGVRMIQSQAHDVTNHIFPARAYNER